MIVKVSKALRIAIFKVPSLGTPISGTDSYREDPAITPLPGAFPEKVEDLSHLLPLIPEWFKVMLYDGNFIILDKQEYLDLDPEISAHLEVIH